MQSQMDALTEGVNVELEAGNWSEVVTLTVELYVCAVAAGEEQLAELVQDVHWIANDALVHPLEVGVVSVGMAQAFVQDIPGVAGAVDSLLAPALPAF